MRLAAENWVQGLRAGRDGDWPGLRDAQTALAFQPESCRHRLVELNEDLAVQVDYCRDRLSIDPSKLNVNGSSIAIGHPFGMTGARLVGTIGSQSASNDGRRAGMMVFRFFCETPNINYQTKLRSTTWQS